MAGIFGLDKNTWDGMISDTKNKLGAVDVGRQQVFSEKTTLKRFRILPDKEGELGKTVEKYARAAQQDVQRMKDAAAKVAEEDLLCARMFTPHEARF